MRCGECGADGVKPMGGVGRTIMYRDVDDLPIPEDLLLPTCPTCSAFMVGGPTVNEQEAAFAKVYEALKNPPPLTDEQRAKLLDLASSLQAQVDQRKRLSDPSAFLVPWGGTHWDSFRPEDPNEFFGCIGWPIARDDGPHENGSPSEWVAVAWTSQAQDRIARLWNTNIGVEDPIAYNQAVTAALDAFDNLETYDLEAHAFRNDCTPCDTCEFVRSMLRLKNLAPKPYKPPGQR